MTKRQANLFLEMESCYCMVQSGATYSFMMGEISIISEKLPDTIPL